MRLITIIIAFCAGFYVSYSNAETKSTTQPTLRVIQTDSVGNKQYHMPQYVVKGDKMYQTDSVGNVQYHKPSYSVQSQETKGKSK